jgi:hypothetical protein
MPGHLSASNASGYQFIAITGAISFPCRFSMTRALHEAYASGERGSIHARWQFLTISFAKNHTRHALAGSVP